MLMVYVLLTVTVLSHITDTIHFTIMTITAVNVSHKNTIAIYHKATSTETETSFEMKTNQKIFSNDG